MSDLERQVGITSRLTREGGNNYRGNYAMDNVFGRGNGNQVNVDGQHIFYKLHLYQQDPDASQSPQLLHLEGPRFYWQL